MSDRFTLSGPQAPAAVEAASDPRGGGRLGSWLVRAWVLVGVLLVVAGGMLALGWVPAGSGGAGPAQVLEEVPVTAMDLGVRRAVTSPVVARDPTTPTFVVAATRTDAPGPGCDLHVSGDAGRGWLPVRAVKRLPEGLGACYAPDVGFSPDGRLIFSFVGVAGPPPRPQGLYVVTSSDHAQTFTQPVRIADVATFAVDTVVTGTGLEAVWVDPVADRSDRKGTAAAVGARVVAAAGDSAGLATPVVVADSDALVAAPVMAASLDGVASVAFYQLPGDAPPTASLPELAMAGPWQLMVASRGPGAKEFGDPVLVGEVNLAVPNAPSGSGGPRLVSMNRGIAAPGLAASTDKMCASWTRMGRISLDAQVGCSQDGGHSWQTPTGLEPAGANEGDQWLPQVSIADGGRVEAVFYSRSRGETSDGAHVYYAATESVQDGVGEVLQLTSAASSPEQAPLAGWYGTRLGLDSHRRATLALWPDSRHGLRRSYTYQTVSAAMIQIPSTAGGPSLGLALGLLLSGVVVAALAGSRVRRYRVASDSSGGDMTPGEPAKPEAVP